jgi:hypothetical protein
MSLNTPLGNQDLPPEAKELTPEELDLLNRVAAKIVHRQMVVPAIMFLESVKPLNWIGSQVMVFLDPFVSAIVGEKSKILFNYKDYNLLRQMMERRENTERLLQKIEELDAIQNEKEREEKRKRKAEKKGTGGSKISNFWRKLFGRENPTKTIPPPDNNSKLT